jgi:1-acyl-sn-glycerol-3-phosphate acyltransferase
MIGWLRRRNPGRALHSLIMYEIGWRMGWLVLHGCFSYRKIIKPEAQPAFANPPSGPVIIISNHQSHLDPMIVGMMFPKRHLYFVARATLFKNRLFGWIINQVNADPIKQGESDMVGIRRTIDLVQQGKWTLMFPEGTRTRTGEMGEFKRGCWIVINKTKATVLPCALTGGFDAFPPGKRPRPFRAKVRAIAGPPIPFSVLENLGPDAGLAHLQKVVTDLHNELQAKH